MIVLKSKYDELKSKYEKLKPELRNYKKKHDKLINDLHELNQYTIEKDNDLFNSVHTNFSNIRLLIGERGSGKTTFLHNKILSKYISNKRYSVVTDNFLECYEEKSVSFLNGNFESEIIKDIILKSFKKGRHVIVENNIINFLRPEHINSILIKKPRDLMIVFIFNDIKDTKKLSTFLDEKSMVYFFCNNRPSSEIDELNELSYLIKKGQICLTIKSEDSKHDKPKFDLSFGYYSTKL